MQNAPDPSSDTASAVLELLDALLAELSHGGASHPTASLGAHLERDLGLDSLSRVELLLRMEQHFGVELPEALLAEAETPQYLVAAVRRAAVRRPAAAAAPARLAPLKALHDGEPVAAETLLDMLAWHVDRHADRVHVRLLGDDDAYKELTYADLDRQARAVAAGLAARDIGPGQTVAIMLPTGSDYLATFYGVLLAGAVPVPIYPPVRPSQVEEHLQRHARILDNAQTALLVTVPAARPLARILRASVPALRAVVTVDDLASTGGPPRHVEVAADDLALLQYTSGSTGTPKGVELTHANLLANLRAMGRAIGAGPDDVFVSWLPLYHDMGLIGAWLGSLYFAIPLVLMSPLQFLARPARWLQAIDRHRGTLSAGPNFAYDLCLRKVPDSVHGTLDLSSWRLAFNGAEPVSATTLRGFAERYAGCGFRREALAPVFGLAECALGLAFPPPGRGMRIDRIDPARFARDGIAAPVEAGVQEAAEVVACGQVLPGYQARIVDDGSSELPDRHAGRLQFSGPSATRGYHRNPAATAALFDGSWLDSGDLAYIADGELYITGRVKDLIIRAGRNIYPHELEEAVSAIEGIRYGCVAVFGVPEAESGTERLVVVAETREQAPGTRAALEQAIQAAAVDRLGTPAEQVVLVAPHTVLKTSSGKVRRSAVRELFMAGELGRKPHPVWWQLTRAAAGSLRAAARNRWRRVTRRVYAGYAWSLLVLCTLPAWLLILLLPRRAWRWQVARWSVRVVGALAGIPVRRLGRPDLPDGPCVVVANHQSYLDALVLTALLPRPVVFVAKAELTRQWFVRVLLKRLGCLFVERFDLARSVADAGGLEQVLARGEVLCVFPEGTFDRAPGLRPFKLGGFVAAARAGVPVVPVTLRGTRSILRSGSWTPHRGAVVVRLGEALHHAGRDWEAAVALRAEARAAILASAGEPDRGA